MRLRPVIPVLLTVLVVAAAAWVAVAGWQFRRWTWKTTVPIRYTSDIERGFQWGRSALADGRDASGSWHLCGLLNQYEKMQPESGDWFNWLDYAPLRLVVMTAWASDSQTNFPKIKQLRDDRSYDFTQPVLLFNSGMEIFGAVAAFGLVRSWIRRCADSTAMPWWRGSIIGLLAASVFWLNPAVVLSAHGWPTWDVWIIPMYLLAAWAAVGDRWLWAGVAIGVGAMFKGQQLAVTPVFVLWALAARKPGAAVRFAIGVLVAIATITLPWLMTYIPPDALAAARAIQFNRVRHPWDVAPGVFDLPRAIDWPAVCWVAGAALVTASISQISSMGILPMHSFSSKKSIGRMPMLLVGSAAVALTVTVWPWMLKANRPNIWVGLAAAISILSVSWFVRRRALVIAAVISVALLASPSLFHGSYAWWDVGIGFGARHWPVLSLGNTDTLPALLNRHFGWANDRVDAVLFTVRSHTLGRYPATDVDVSIRQGLGALCTGLICLTGVGLGLHAHRRDRRLLTAVVAPWLLLYLIPVQMQERYLLFAAGSACVCIGDSIGTAALGLVLSLATLLTTLQTMLDQNPLQVDVFGKVLAREFPSWLNADAGAKLHRSTAGATPDFGWALLVIGAVFLYLSLAPSRDVDWRFSPARFIRYLGRRDVTTPTLPDAGQCPPRSETALESANPSTPG